MAGPFSRASVRPRRGAGFIASGAAPGRCGWIGAGERGGPPWTTCTRPRRGGPTSPSRAMTSTRRWPGTPASRRCPSSTGEPTTHGAAAWLGHADQPEHPFILVLVCPKGRRSARSRRWRRSPTSGSRCRPAPRSTGIARRGGLGRLPAVATDRPRSAGRLRLRPGRPRRQPRRDLPRPGRLREGTRGLGRDLTAPATRAVWRGRQRLPTSTVRGSGRRLTSHVRRSACLDRRAARLMQGGAPCPEAAPRRPLRVRAARRRAAPAALSSPCSPSSSSAATGCQWTQRGAGLGPRLLQLDGVLAHADDGGHARTSTTGRRCRSPRSVTPSCSRDLVVTAGVDGSSDTRRSQPSRPRRPGTGASVWDHDASGRALRADRRARRTARCVRRRARGRRLRRRARPRRRTPARLRWATISSPPRPPTGWTTVSPVLTVVGNRLVLSGEVADVATTRASPISRSCSALDLTSGAVAWEPAAGRARPARQPRGRRRRTGTSRGRTRTSASDRSAIPRT